jgi:hypothetical protein
MLVYVCNAAEKKGNKTKEFLSSFYVFDFNSPSLTQSHLERLLFLNNSDFVSGNCSIQPASIDL